jgi:hypothetical protein
MTTGSTLHNQLAAAGVVVPAWPEALDEHTPGDEWIQQGQAYAADLQLLRAQLHNAMGCDGTGGDYLLRSVREAGRLSSWHQAVIGHLLGELQAGSRHERVQAAAQLVAAEVRTPAQLLGVAIDLASCGLVGSAAHAIKRLLQQGEATAAQELELCALLVAALKVPIDAPSTSPATNHRSWLNHLAVQQQAIKLLAAAGQTSRGALSAHLETLEQLAADLQAEGSARECWAIQSVAARERRKRSQPHAKPVLRTIHHLACTGGTVISKCLAAMPQVALISEVNPLNRHGSGFEPTNPLLQMESSYRQLSIEEIKADFLRQIRHAYEICSHDDVDLILRDHSHTDFCTGTEPTGVCPIADYLGSSYTLQSVLTVRHPLDSYLSLLAQQWKTKFIPNTLEEYSRRYLAFLDRYANLPLRRYEDFCRQPEAFMQELCDLLEISYSADFLQHFGEISLSGDSGRKDLGTISLRPRRSIPEDVADQAASSQTYALLIERLGY